jgi:hypothetical protein
MFKDIDFLKKINIITIKHMNPVIFILICYGACNNIIFGSIFEGFRNYLAKFGTGGYSLHKLFTCFMCLGTWMGFAITTILILSNVPTPLTVDNKVLSVFLHGLFASGGVWLTHTIQEAFERAFDK